MHLCDVALNDIFSEFSEESHPLNTLKKMEKRSPALAYKGLKQCINDSLDMTREYNIEDVAKIDTYLSSKGATSLSEMRRKIWKQIPKILQRGKMRNDEEYCFIVERLNDVDDNDFTEEMRVLGGRLVSDYEARIRSQQIAAAQPPPRGIGIPVGNIIR